MSEAKQGKAPQSALTGFMPLLWALKMRDGLTATTKGVLVALAAYADATGSCYPSIPRLAADARISKRTCQMAIRELEERHFIMVNRQTGRGHASIYRLNLKRDRSARTGEAEISSIPERVQPLHLIPVERVQQLHPLQIERVQALQPKGASVAPQLTIELAKQLKPASVIKNSRTERPLNPRRSDPPERWYHLADRLSDGSAKVETDLNAKSDLGRPIVAGTYLDVAANLICEAAVITDQNWRCNWKPVIAWLRDGFDLTSVIVPAIRRVAARSSYTQPSSLAYFDKAVREFRAVRQMPQ